MGGWGEENKKLLLQSGLIKSNIDESLNYASVPKIIPGKGQVIKYVHDILGSDPIENPIFSSFLNHVLRLGPITNIHDLRASFL